jgi:glycerophosphoryl diester phosphodiesterase
VTPPAAALVEDSPRWGRRAARARPLVIAHRGASAERLENTLSAFARARALGADGIELDTMRCRSGEVVVFHDDDLERLAGRRERIRDLPLAALREVALEGGERIPTLDEVLAALGPLELVNVELKSEERTGAGWLGVLRDDGLPAAVAGVLERHQLGARVLVSSFDPLLLGRFRAAAPDVLTGLLFHRDESRPLREAWAAPVVRPDALHPDARMVSARAVARWRRGGRAVNVWTVDDPREIACLAALGVDGIITNRPDVARRVLAQAMAR